MSQTKDEIVTITNQLIEKHGSDIMSLVSLWRFYVELARPYGAIGELNNVAFTKLIVKECQALGKPMSALEAALKDIERAGQTVSYLLSLGD